MSDYCTNSSIPTSEEQEAEAPAQKASTKASQEKAKADKDELIAKGLSFLAGLNTDVAVFEFIAQLTHYDKYTLLASILKAHEKVSAEALGAFTRYYNPEKTKATDVESCALATVNASDLWWSYDSVEKTNTVMLRNSLVPYWTPFYGFTVNMISVRDLASFGAKPMTDKQADDYEARFGLLTPGIDAKVLLSAPIKH